jgi:ATP-dependent DNA ligase
MPQENGVPSSSTLSPVTFQQFRQPRDVHRNAARFILGEHLRLHRLGFVRPAVDIGERLAIGVAHKIAPVIFSAVQWGGQVTRHLAQFLRRLSANRCCLLIGKHPASGGMINLGLRPKGFVQPCIPSPASAPPARAGWAHEIKHDGYRLIVRRVATSVRLFTRRGYDWKAWFPVIAAAATKLRAGAFTLDGEAVVCGPDGVAVFEALHTDWRLGEAFLYAFDLMEMGRGGPAITPIQ